MERKTLIFLIIIILPAIFVAGFLLFSTNYEIFANMRNANRGKVVIENVNEFINSNTNIQAEGNIEKIENMNLGSDVIDGTESIVEKVDEVDSLATDIKDESAKVDADIEIEKEAEKKTIEIKIIRNIISWGYEKKSSRNIDTIIIHSSYDALGSEPYNVRGLIEEYRQYEVAPHYLIDREGGIYQLVEDKNVAYHAGQSQVPDGRTGVNDFSLGIELMNTKKEKYTAEQYGALNEILDYLKGKYKIKYVLGHNQISPGRKDDPWNFDWNKVD
ncbi:MAG: N-acetylmuramyl-L-alanine amidase, negative regulator of AmpC, AmpD [Candidatus Moranbacteria bacterium GW2011_GWE2_35_2-]|nr:MAG: N-acetylmuramyl-L-alanine amidase, negative regulator of AmpC, AmpD [Candidatus Moranbacteria bacterium GW2011_GWE2_35_2-]KKQ22229.1 MAG: N-acetylmuramyl-L-alanine amidase, negative regulator of AmpC, AmpD [Candidatus Moranbacteria bacterium GW2011_GWF2_37_11]KKQ30279.1 MAG: N-acetylmuramyl-L-alanine amidase, negative regulator of AmpC, AmpD [Candidatus Moranbacteria bacterium GW2011_GWE1_37_24]KKQ46923.1 MAG: N-acetylmuramyl-L-alanine amidase, negative regulator of AmpC, AmpD [Candidatu